MKLTNNIREMIATNIGYDVMGGDGVSPIAFTAEELAAMRRRPRSYKNADIPEDVEIIKGVERKKREANEAMESYLKRRSEVIDYFLVFLESYDNTSDLLMDCPELEKYVPPRYLLDYREVLAWKDK